ncbi:hypothetical protein [Rhizobium laguerreae]|uniref:Uncharacterized protein n=1 Tax=Rhizobium laguerreae TaxID=1076926 RepID=A0A6N9ZER5_9HYPH|nr:hypothetical protein [Rhizobium laguerreae]NEH91992.1 hypothetical protein [Rhizobium laguerreae]
MVIFHQGEREELFKNCGVLPPSDPATTKIDHIHEDGARCAGEKDLCLIGSSGGLSRESNRKSSQNNYLDTK